MMNAQQGGCEEKAKDQVWYDWTATKDEGSNSSPEFARMADEIATILWDYQDQLGSSSGRHEVARTIVATLAHGENMMPVNTR